MVVDIDIWRAANMLLRDHGYDAPIIAAQRCHKLAQDGDLDGLRLWKRSWTQSNGFHAGATMASV